MMKTTDFNDFPAMLSVEQAANMLNVSEQSIRRMVNREEIPSIKIGRIIRIPRQKTLEILKLI